MKKTTFGALTLPTIHLNGTSRATLAAIYEAAMNSVQEAITAVAEAPPNRRDYEVQGADAFVQAVLQHTARLQALSDIEAELMAILNAVIDGNAAPFTDASRGVTRQQKTESREPSDRRRDATADPMAHEFVPRIRGVH